MGAPSVLVPRWLSLGVGLWFYTAFALVFFVPLPLVRVLAFLVLWSGWRTPRLPWGLCLTAGVVTGGIAALTVGPLEAAGVGAGWGAVTAALLLGLSVYPQVFRGADWAAVARITPVGSPANNVLIAYSTFRLVPEFEERIRRIFVAARVYGGRTHAGRSGLGRLVHTLVDALVLYFLEAIEVILSFERILLRRLDVVVESSHLPRRIDLRTTLASTMYGIIILVGLVLHLC